MLSRGINTFIDKYIRMNKIFEGDQLVGFQININFSFLAGRYMTRYIVKLFWVAAVQVGPC